MSRTSPATIATSPMEAQNALSATCAVCERSTSSPWITSTIASDAAYTNADGREPEERHPELTTVDEQAHEQRCDGDAEHRDESLRQIGDAVEKRFRRRLVGQGVQRGEDEERAREHERAPFPGPARDPGEDDGLGRPAHDERRPVERERQGDAREPQPDGDEERGDLAAHALAESEASERDVRDRQREHPRGGAVRAPRSSTR